MEIEQQLDQMESQHNRHVEETQSQLESLKEFFEKNRSRRDQVITQKINNIETLEQKIEGLLSQNS
jgi:hypothetical protein